MGLDNAFAWATGAREALQEAQGARATFELQQQQAKQTLDSLIQDVRNDPLAADGPPVRRGPAATLSRCENVIIDTLSINCFGGFSDLQKLSRRFDGSRQHWDAQEASFDLNASLEQLDRELADLAGSCSRYGASLHNARMPDQLAELVSNASAEIAPLPERRDPPMFYMDPSMRADRLKLALWLLPLLFILASLTGFGLLWMGFLGTAAWLGIAWAITAQFDQENSSAASDLREYAQGINRRVAQLHSEAACLLIALVEDSAARLNALAADADRACREIVAICESAKMPVASGADLKFGQCTIPPMLTQVAARGKQSNFADYAHHRNVSGSGDEMSAGDRALRAPLPGCVAWAPLADCDLIDVIVKPECRTTELAAGMIAGVLKAVSPGRHRFMFVEPGRLAESYRVFGSLNDAPSTRLGERLFITHVSELSSAVDALRTFVGRTKEAMTRRGDSERRITALEAEDGAVLLQRAVVVIDQTEYSGWPEKDRRRIGEFIEELRALAEVGAREGSVLLIDISRTASPGTTDTASQCRQAQLEAWPEGLVLEGNVFVPYPPQESSAQTGEYCDTWTKAAKKADSALRQVAVALDWSDTERSDSRYGIEVDIGRHGTDRPARLVLGSDGGHHAICIGRTGSGKTNLFHVIISNLVRRYSPDEIELYLLDFKEGVEFAVYADQLLPHCRAVAIDADRGFGLSVLNHLRRELNRRASIFKGAGIGITSLERFEEATGQNMPRIVLVIDEFQVLLAAERTAGAASGAAASALEDLVRRGRSFGLHVILGSQTLAGRELTAATLGQLAIRIVLPCSAADASTLLGEQPISNQLRGPGDAIVWRAGQGDVSDSHLAKIFAANLDDLPALATASKASMSINGGTAPTPFIFRGSGHGDLAEILPHIEATKASSADGRNGFFAIGAPTAFGERPAGLLQNRRSRNLLFVHRSEDSRTDFLYSAVKSLLQLQPDVRVQLCDFEDARTYSNVLSRELLTKTFGERVEIIEPSELAAHVDALASRTGLPSKSGRTVLAIAGAARAGLARSVTFAQLLKEGPESGLHVFATCDSVKNLERLIDRSLVAEFGMRGLGPASGGDSQKLLDANDAETLSADHQYLFYDDAASGRLARLQVLSPALDAAEVSANTVNEVTHG